MEFNINSYSNYYSLDDLNQQLGKYNIQLDSLVRLNIKEIFKTAVKYGIVDLVEYLYVFHNVEYEISELNEIIPLSRIDSVDTGLGVTSIYAPGANAGLNLQYYSANDINVQKSINKLNGLRKYSNMRSSNKKFYYKFNPKYREKIFA